MHRISLRPGKMGGEGVGSPERCKVFIAIFGLLKYHIFSNVMGNGKWAVELAIIVRNMLNGVFSRFKLVFKGFSRDIGIPYNFQLTIMKELFVEISGNFTKLSYINSIYFRKKKNWKFLIERENTGVKLLKTPFSGTNFRMFLCY